MSVAFSTASPHVQSVSRQEMGVGETLPANAKPSPPAPLPMHGRGENGSHLP